MAGRNAVDLAVANASLQASVLQQNVRVFQTSAKTIDTQKPWKFAT